MNDELQALASDALFAISDLYDDDELDDIEALDDVAKIQLRYTRSDCDDFAFALNSLTGWSSVAVSSPTKGPLHRLNIDPEGRLVDVTGFVTEDDLRKRYNSKALIVTVGVEPDSMLTEHEDVSRVVAAMKYMPSEPFTTPAFRGLIEAWLAAGSQFGDEVDSTPKVVFRP